MVNRPINGTSAFFFVCVPMVIYGGAASPACLGALPPRVRAHQRGAAQDHPGEGRRLRHLQNLPHPRATKSTPAVCCVLVTRVDRPMGNPKAKTHSPTKVSLPCGRSWGGCGFGGTAQTRRRRLGQTRLAAALQAPTPHE